MEVSPVGVGSRQTVSQSSSDCQQEGSVCGPVRSWDSLASGNGMFLSGWCLLITSKC